jgi:Fusaric acid resistance protein-like
MKPIHWRAGKIGRHLMRVPDRHSTAGAFIAHGLSWSDPGGVPPSRIVAAALGLSMPIALGAFAGHIETGMLASMGGLALSSIDGAETFSEHMSNLGYAILAGCAAMLIGAALAGRGYFTMVFPLIAGAAALLGSISRPLARATTFFILYSIIAMHLEIQGASPIALTAVFLMGAAWCAGLGLVLKPIFRKIPCFRKAEKHAVPPRTARHPARRLLRRWAKTLGELSGWQYALRMTLCLAAGESFEWIWPDHHGYWVLITVVIVLQRDLRAMLRRIFQRSAGTLAGVLLAGLLLIGSLPPWATIVLVAVLAAGRVALKKANYGAYAVVMTILVVVLLDFGRPPSVTIIIDRLVATLAGCALAMTLGYLPWLRPLARNA